ncbi:MAG: GGDEF domain-containing protein [Burkholderiales bacterium]|nr:GGDEF domain-containing protein [Burkholderiales bacterium]
MAADNAAMSGNVALVVLTLMLLQLVAAAAWALGGVGLKISGQPARHWCVFGLAGAAAMAIFLSQELLPSWLAMSLGNVVLVGAMLAMWRGLLVFVRQPRRDAEAGVIALSVLLISAACALLPSPQAMTAQTMVGCAGLIWALVRTGITAWPGLRAEFGDKGGHGLLSPIVATAALLALQLVDSASLAIAGYGQRPAEAPFHLASLLLLLVLWLLIHGSLALMVLTRVVRKLRHLSQHDPLTGLINRAEWTRRLETQHRWLGRYGDAFALLLIDVDHFKNVNDTLGHAAGDAVLASMAQVLTASARDVDLVGRIGGEEFAVLLPRADLAAARRAAERLRQMMADTEVQWRQQPIRVTVSIGVALATDADESPQHLSERADQALYQAKANGRNRVVVARRP